MSRLTVHAEVNDVGERVCTVIGDLDAGSCTMFEAELDVTSLQPDVIDLRFVPFITAAGVNAVLRAHRVRAVRVIASAVVSRVLAVCGLTETLTVRDPDDPPVVDGMETGVAVHDADLRFLYVNAAMARINGLAKDAHLGMTPTDLFQIDHDELTPILRRVLETRTECETFASGATAAGTGHWRCLYRHVLYRNGDDQCSAVIATVEPVEAPMPAGAIEVAFAHSE